MRFYKLLILMGLILGCEEKSSIQEIYTTKEESEKNSPEEALSEDQVHVLLKLHNEQRELRGRVGFILDPYLCEYAQKHSEYMAKKNLLRHSNTSVLLNKYSRVGENIAWNQTTEAEVLDAWMHSSGHRANIMNHSFTKIGFGVAPNKNGEFYWVTCFGG